MEGRRGRERMGVQGGRGREAGREGKGGRKGGQRGRRGLERTEKRVSARYGPERRIKQGAEK
eukprot:211598-Rhodomonas_salina.1